MNVFTRTDSWVLASHNPGKIKELVALLAPRGLTVLGAGTLGLPEPEETENSFSGNARLKAEAAAQASGRVSLADDSGLSVDALGGAPGVYSARWAGPGKDFTAAMERVRRELEAMGAKDFGARFVCVLALAHPDGETRLYEGEVRGTLVFPRAAIRASAMTRSSCPRAMTGLLLKWTLPPNARSAIAPAPSRP